MRFLLAFLLFSHLVLAQESTTEATAKLSTKTEVLVQNEQLPVGKEADVATSTTANGQNVSEKLSTKKENEIPLNLESKKTASTNDNPFFKFILVVGILGTLLAGAWIFLKKYNTKNISKNHNEIKILAQHYLGPKKSLAVVRVAGESILVGITDNNINMIKSLALLDEELPEVTPNDFGKLISKDEDLGSSKVKDQVQVSAKSVNSKSINNTYSRSTFKNPVKNQISENSEAEDDEFSIKGIKDIVSSKLKNMRSI